MYHTLLKSDYKMDYIWWFKRQSNVTEIQFELTLCNLHLEQLNFVRFKSELIMDNILM